MFPFSRRVGAFVALLLGLLSATVRAGNCVDELRSLPPDERDAVYLDLGDELGLPSSVSTSWLSGGPFQEPYEDLLQAAYLVTHENDDWYRELYYRLFGTTKYARARWTLHVYDWVRNPGFWTPFRRERGLALDDSLRVFGEDIAQSIVEAFRRAVEEYPTPPYFLSQRDWRARFDSKFTDYVRTTNGVPRGELERFGSRATLGPLLLRALPLYHRHHDYVPYEREAFEREAQRFAAHLFPDTPSIALALARSLGVARLATLPPLPTEFRRHLQTSFLGALRVGAATLLREHNRRERRATLTARADRAEPWPPPSEAQGRAVAVLPAPSITTVSLSKYRRRQLAAAVSLVEPEGETPLEDTPLELTYSEVAQRQMDEFDADRSRRGVNRQLKKALLHLATNQKHPGLSSHRFDRPSGLWMSYVQNGTGSNYRLIWRYVPRQRCIEVERIIPHT